MRKLCLGIFIGLLLITACAEKDNSPAVAFDVYCEMVASSTKPMALQYPMDSKSVDRYWSDFEQLAVKHNVALHREDDFPSTLLFQTGLTDGKTIVIIYRGDRLTQYQQLKTDIQSGKNSSWQDRLLLARRFGRLLGYSPQGINELLSKNSEYKNLKEADVIRQVTHLYYENPENAMAFYGQTLGLSQSGEATFHVSEDAFIKINPLSERHPKGQVKSTAIAFLTNQLPDWYAYVQEKGIPIKYTYKPRDGGPHDGFVVIDPEGYLLEFEQFKQHPENELFMANLAKANPLKTAVNELAFFGSITWTYHKDVLKLQNFYENVLGFELVADQGWTKIYQTSPSGFIGLVDERRGMEDYADTKAVEIEWGVTDDLALKNYANKYWKSYGFENGSWTGPEKYQYHLISVK
ncbi:MAG: VOC family protein [Bacteroidota bacterium]